MLSDGNDTLEANTELWFQGTCIKAFHVGSESVMAVYL
jgi:hypothetical protein